MCGPVGGERAWCFHLAGADTRWIISAACQSLSPTPHTPPPALSPPPALHRDTLGAVSRRSALRRQRPDVFITLGCRRDICSCVSRDSVFFPPVRKKEQTKSGVTFDPPGREEDEAVLTCTAARFF